MDYNPRSPQNVGNEWVPIKQANLTPDNFNEYGYVMRLDHTATVVSGGIGINVLAPQITANISEGINVYPFLTADDTGPVRLLTIPVQSGTITGSNIFTSSGGSVASVLENPTDGSYLELFGASTPPDRVGLNFGVTAFANELSGKRIVKLRLIYTAASDDATSLEHVRIQIVRAANFAEQFTYQTGIEGLNSANSQIAPPLVSNTNYNYVDLGDWNPTWGAGISQLTADTIFPWRYTELAQLDTATSIASRQQISIDSGFATIVSAQIGYLALQVFYCEETRVAYGGRRQVTLPASIDSPFRLGENRVPIRSTAYAATTTLTPGLYVVTATHRPVSNVSTAKLPPTYAAIRQLNESWPVVGQVVKPTIVVDDDFVIEPTDVITDISLFTAVAAVTGCHVYSNQIGAPVYGGISATQDIHVRQEITAATSYTQVRFYARRFGDTQVALKITLGSSTASILPDDFDALDEIFDGWKEVTLTLSPALSLTGDAIQTAVWSALAELAGNQWQVLGASSYSTSPNINVATYDPPGGGTTELTWKSPNVTSSTVDAQSDATVILAQSLPAPTSLVLTTLSQPVTGVATECSLPNGCVPTGIDYVNLAWNLPGSCDDFERSVASGWGTDTSGDAWTIPAFTGTSLVDGSRGVINHSATNDYFTATIDVGVPDQQVYATFSPSVLALTSSITMKVMARFTDVSNYYAAIAVMNTNGTLQLQVSKRVAGVHTIMTTSITVGAYDANSDVGVVLRVVGNWIYAKCWSLDEDEPPSWQAILQDTSLTTGNRAGVRSRLESGNTNTQPVALYVDNFSAWDARYVDATLQVQRQDDVDEDWETILLAQSYCLPAMQDYEARVGMESRYRVRYCDSLDFCGPWVSGAATVTAPGVDVGASGDGVLIFTSNRQPGSNLAYTMIWEGQPVETFAFPEADTQVLQRMFGRDFQVAFRPLERGGEQFDRTILVQAAAIPVPSLADFRGLRDLAWADLPYVCVRDELGNRWFANVLVPAGSVQRGRRIYIAQIRVTEVAGEPAPIT